jgi:large subunit ribosomal protein L15
MPVQRRLPKFGFSSRRKVFNAQVTLKELSSLAAVNPIDLSVLKSHGIVPKSTLKAKIILSGEISVAVVTKGLICTKSAKDAILSAGGTVED